MKVIGERSKSRVIRQPLEQLCDVGHPESWLKALANLLQALRKAHRVPLAAGAELPPVAVSRPASRRGRPFLRVASDWPHAIRLDPRRGRLYRNRACASPGFVAASGAVRASVNIAFSPSPAGHL